MNYKAKSWLRFQVMLLNIAGQKAQKLGNILNAVSKFFLVITNDGFQPLRLFNF